VFLNYILHWGALRFYALLKGALTEKSLRKADLVNEIPYVWIVFKHVSIGHWGVNLGHL